MSSSKVVPENPISPVSMLSVSGEPSALDCQRTLGQNTADSGLQAFPPTLANFDFGLDIAVRAAQQQTGAAAAALALMQDNLLVCRARVGNDAHAHRGPAVHAQPRLARRRRRLTRPLP